MTLGHPLDVSFVPSPAPGAGKRPLRQFVMTAVEHLDRQPTVESSPTATFAIGQELPIGVAVEFASKRPFARRRRPPIPDAAGYSANLP